jgi:hypothetical protein
MKEKLIDKISLEKSELDGKIEKLDSFLYKSNTIIRTTQSNLLKCQLYIMKSYSEILQARIEDLELSND